MTPPEIIGTVAIAALVSIVVGILLSAWFPHWGMRHTKNKPAPGVTEARYAQMYPDDNVWDAAFRRGAERRAGLVDDDDDAIIRRALERRW